MDNIILQEIEVFRQQSQNELQRKKIKFSEWSSNKEGRTYGMEKDHCKLFWFEYFNNRNIDDAKQHLYLIGRLMDIVNQERKSSYMRNPGEMISYLFLSDSEDLIERFKNWKVGKYMNIQIGGIIPCIKHFLRGEVYLAKLELENFYNRRSYKEDNSLWKGDDLFLRGILNNEIDLVREGIEYLFTSEIHEKRNGIYEFRKKLYSIPGILYLKLAWILGYEIEINSPLALMELMPVQPLKKYKVPYFFLDGFEGVLPSPYVQWLSEKDTQKPVEQNGNYDSWNREKYRTRNEAIIVENSIRKGCKAIRDEKGNWKIFK